MIATEYNVCLEVIRSDLLVASEARGDSLMYICIRTFLHTLIVKLFTYETENADFHHLIDNVFNRCP